VSGIYYINISIDFDKDMVSENNFIATEVVEVLKFYDSFETLDDAWEWIFDPGWVRKEVVNDEFPKQHSRTHAWFISNSGENQTNQNSSNILYSPIIDLEGAQTNELYKNDQIKIDFKWYGNGNPGDKLYFEYAIDHSDNWGLFTLPLGESSIITGNALDSWHSWANLGTTELFGHDVQFRWRFKSNSESGDDIGYYIDDFSVWVVQEEYGRPEITDINAFPNSLINDGQDEIEISCRIISRTWGMEEVFINLEPVGGSNKQPLNNIFFDFIDVFLGYWGGDYNINLTVPSYVPENDYILQITAVDLNGRTDHSYVKITVKENSAPEILEYYPGNSSISIFESEMIDFSVMAYDAEDGYNLHYNWYLNSNKIANLNNNFYLFKTDYHGNISAGRHILEVIISDNGLPSKSVQFEWIIDVLEVLPDFEIREKEIELTTGNVTVNEIIELVVPIHNLRPPPERNVTVHLIQQSTNISIGETVYNTYKIDILFGNYKEILTLTWRGNTSYQYLKVWVDPNNNITEIFEENNYAIIPVNVSQPPIIIEDKPKNDNNTKQNQIPYLFYIITGSVIFSLLILFITVSTEIGNYRLFLLFAPLYSRVTGDKILEHQLRLKIYSYIRAHPGDHYRSIMAKLKIKNGTLVHHLSRLEQEELIKSERDGYFKRFYPVGMRIPKSDVGMYYPEGIATYNIGEHQVSAIQLRILRIIKKEPGLTQKEISQRVKESRRVVNYHVKLLEQHELIKIIKNGRETQCYVRDKSSEISG
jgi:predicted transcriptional regulator